MTDHMQSARAQSNLCIHWQAGARHRKAAHAQNGRCSHRTVSRATPRAMSSAGHSPALVASLTPAVRQPSSHGAPPETGGRVSSEHLGEETRVCARCVRASVRPYCNTYADLHVRGRDVRTRTYADGTYADGTYRYAYVRARLCACVLACVHACFIAVFIHVYLYTCAYTHVYAHAHTHVRTHAHAGATTMRNLVLPYELELSNMLVAPT